MILHMRYCFHIFMQTYTPLQFNNDKAIIDSGTTDIFLPIAVYEQVEAAFKEHFIVGSIAL